MKTTAVLALLSSTAFAAPSLPTFGGQSVTVPELSLSDAIKEGRMAQVDSGLLTAPASVRRIQPIAKKHVSRMPMIAPNNVDPKMPILTPDTAIDHKMIVLEPRVELVK